MIERTVSLSFALLFHVLFRLSYQAVLPPCRRWHNKNQIRIQNQKSEQSEIVPGTATGINKKKEEQLWDILKAKNHPASFFFSAELFSVQYQGVKICLNIPLSLSSRLFWSIFINLLLHRTANALVVSVQCCSLLFQLVLEIKARVQHFGKEAYSFPGDFAAGWREIIQHVHIYNSVNWSLMRASTSLFVKSARAE